MTNRVIQQASRSSFAEDLSDRILRHTLYLMIYV